MYQYKSPSKYLPEKFMGFLTEVLLPAIVVSFCAGTLILSGAIAVKLHQAPMVYDCKEVIHSFKGEADETQT